MTAPSLRQLLADVLHREMDNGWLGEKPLVDQLSDALLACPELAAIVDLAAWYDQGSLAVPKPDRYDSPEVRALLADWRANR